MLNVILLRPITLLLIAASWFNFNCHHDSMPATNPPVTPPSADTLEIDVLCLGDSYTKGESVEWARNFPNQLVDSLRADGRKVAEKAPRVIAQTGWRTDQLQSAIAAATDLADSTFSLVTLCIGVNNQYQNANFETYKTQFEELLKTAIARAGGDPNHVVVVSIPDWAYTTYGQNYPGEPSNISSKIDQYNAANLEISTRYQVHYVDVTPTSRRGLAEPFLVAGDGLHPSAEQYTAWVRLLLPVVREIVD
jgi:lysophospholipase L1-like esterase